MEPESSEASHPTGSPKSKPPSYLSSLLGTHNIATEVSKANADTQTLLNKANSDTQAKLDAMSKKFEEAADKNTASVTSMKDDMHTAAGALVSLKDHLTSALTKAFGFVKLNVVRIAEVLSSLILTLIAVYRSTDTLARLAMLSAWALANGIVTSAVSGLVSLATRTGLYQQANDDVESETILDSIMYIFQSFFHSHTPHESANIVKRMSLIRAYVRFFDYGYKGFSFVLHALSLGFFSFYEWFMGHPYIPHDQMDLYKSIISYLSTTYTLIQDKPDINSTFARWMIHRLAHKGDRIAIRIAEVGMVASTVNVFNDARRKINELHTEVQHIEKTAHGRIKPLVIQLSGPSNSGKTVLASLLTRDIMRANDMEYEPDDEFAWPMDEKFTEGYHHQFMTIMDDFMQNPDHDARSKVLLQVIRLANDATCPMPMAFSGKGETFFDSRILFLTSNEIELPGAQTEEEDQEGTTRKQSKTGSAPLLESSVAFQSRRDLLAYVTSRSDVIQEGSKRRTLKSSDISCGIYSIQLYDPITEVPVGQAMSYAKFLLLCLGRYRELEMKDGNLKARIAEMDAEDEVKGIIDAYKASKPTTTPNVNNNNYKRPPLKPSTPSETIASVSSTVLDHTKLEEQGEDTPDVNTPEGRKQVDDAADEMVQKMDPQMLAYLTTRLGYRTFKTNPPPTNLSEADQKLLKTLAAAGAPPLTIQGSQKGWCVWDRFKKMVSTIWEALKSAASFLTYAVTDGIKVGLQVAVGFLTAIAALKGFTLLYTYFMPDKTVKEESSPQHLIHKDPARVATPSHTYLPLFSPTEQAVTPDQTALDIINKIAKNSFIIQGPYGSTKGIALGNHAVLIPRHVLGSVDDDFTKVEVSIQFDKETPVIIPIKECKGSKSPVDDHVFLDIPAKYMSAKPRITHHFLKDADLPYLDSNTVAIVVKNREGHVETRSATCPSSSLSPITFSARAGTRIGNNQNTITIPSLHTSTGECGSPYVLYHKIPRKIFGIHIAGGTHACVSVVTQESIRAAFPDLVEQMEPLPSFDVTCLKTSGVAIFVGTVEPKMAVHMAGKNSRCLSPIAGCLTPIDTLPSLMRPKDGVSPLQVALSRKVTRPENTYWDEHIAAAFEFLASYIPKLVKPTVLTLHEAINTKQGYLHLNHMDMDTSPGYPHNITPHKLKGKHCLFTLTNADPAEYQPTPYCLARIQEHEERLRKSQPLRYLACDNLKDEELPIDKVIKLYDVTRRDRKPYEGYENYTYLQPGEEVIGRTRLMSTMPVELTVITRQRLGAFFENLCRWETSMDCFTALGITSADPVGFARICTKATLFGEDTIIAGDVDSCDASLQAPIQRGIAYVKTAWYDGSISDTDLLMLMNLLEQTSIDVPHIAANVLYTQTSNVSGKFDTTMDNCIALAGLWLAAHSYYNKELPRTDVFVKSIRAFTDFGDDHIGGTWRSSGVTNHTFRDYLAKFGIGYSSPTKSKDMPEYYNIHEVTFLKRHFHIRRPFVFGALDKKVIERIPNYYDPTKPSTLVLACDSAVRESFFWGKEYFNTNKNKVNECLKAAGFNIVTVTYRDIYADYYRTNIAEISARYLPSANLDPKPFILVEQMEPNTIAASSAELTGGVETNQVTTTFIDEAGVSNAQAEAPRIIMSPAEGVDPYPDQGLSTFLERAFPIQQTAWPNTGTSGTLLATITFPAALTAIPSNVEKMNRFQYMQSGTVFGVRLNGTINHSGKLLVTVLKRYSNNSPAIFNPMVNMYSASCNESHLVSAQTNGVVEFDIPFVGPLRFWNMKDDETSSSAAQGCMGYICVWILHPLQLQNTTVSNSLDVTFYAGWKRPKLAGPGLRSVVTPLYRMQAKEARQKSEKNSIGDDLISNFTDPIKQLGYSFVGSAGGLLKGFTGGLGSTVSSLASGVGGQLASVLASSFLSKPTTVQPISRMTPRSMTTMANGLGLDGCEMLSMDPENAVSTDVSIYCDPADYNMFENYKLLPGLVSVFNFSDSTAVGTALVQIPITPTFCKGLVSGPNVVYAMTPLGHLSSFFEWWCGGIKYKIIFSATKMVGCRLRVAYLPDPTAAGAAVSNTDGDVINQVFSVAGDTAREVTMPFLSDREWQKVLDPNTATNLPVVTWPGFNGQMVVTLQNPVVSNNVLSGGTVIWGAVFMSGAEDFQVAQPTYLWNNYSDGTNLANPRPKPKLHELIPLSASAPTSSTPSKDKHFEMQMDELTNSTDLRAAFRKPFAPLVPATGKINAGATMGEIVTSWPTLMKRYSFFKENTGTQIVTIQPYIPNNTVTRWNRVRKSFLFQRGSVRVKIVLNKLSNPNAPLLTVNFNSNALDPDTYTTFADQGCNITLSQHNLITEFQLPYYTPYLMMPVVDPLVTLSDIFGETQFIDVTASGATVDAEIFLSVGDDGTYGCPCAPPPLLYTPPAKDMAVACHKSISFTGPARVLEQYKPSTAPRQSSLTSSDFDRAVALAKAEGATQAPKASRP